MLALYHFDRSTAAQKVRLALAEKGLEWESRVLNPGLDKREQHSPDYLTLNPRGVVPTLIHDGRVIRESQVILEYLEDAFPQSPLRPEDLVRRAEMRVWTKLIDEHLHVDSRTIGQCVAMRHLMIDADPEKLKVHYTTMPEETRRDNDLINNKYGLESPLLPGALRRFKRVFTGIDATLSKQTWLAGDTFSLADISHVVYVARMDTFQLSGLYEPLANLTDWLSRIRSRPSWREAIDRWGDTSSPARVKHGREAWPRVKQIWDAA